MDLFTFLLCKKKGGGGGGLTYTLSADTVNKQIVLTPSEGDAQAITVPYATDASTVNGKDVPELENGKIPATYLPSYVDDVLEYEDLAHFPAEGEVGKIYIALDTSLIYRWGGSVYAEINQSLALGETEATAYRGDRGKIAYDHSQSAHAPSNAEANQNAFSNITVGNTTIEADSKTDTLTLEAGNNITLTPDASTDKVTITATDTTYSDATTSVSGLMSGSDKTKLNGIATGAEVNQNTFSNVKIGSTTVAADSKTDTLELEAGDNIELTPDSTNDKITISGIPVTKTIRDVSIASFSDGGNAPIPSLTASIEPQQDLHGYDSPWAGGAGKNKLNLTTRASATIQGITSEVKADNTIVASGTSTGNGDITCPVETPFTMANGETYTISLNGTDIRNRILTIFIGTSYINIGSINSDAHNFTFTLTRDVLCNQVMFRASNGATININAKLQIEKGSTATAFEPYSNICPISGYTEANVWNGGKNYLNTIQDNVVMVNGGEAPPVISNQSITYNIPEGAYFFLLKAFKIEKCHVGKTYVMSYNISPDRAGYTKFVICNADGSGRQEKALTVTITNTDVGKLLTVRFYPNQEGNFTITNIQVEEGSEPTTYEPYAGTTTTIPFTDGQGQSVEVFGGSIECVSGASSKQFVCEKIPFSNYLTKTDLTNVTRYTYALSNEIDATDYSTQMCNIATVEASYTSDTPHFYCGNMNLGSRAYLFLPIGVEPSVDVDFYYKLATPTTFYTQPTSIKSLDGENNISASTGPLREVTYRTQAYGDFIAQKDLPDAISDIKTLKLDENQILIGDGSFDKIGIFMDNYYDENLDITFSTEVTPQEIYLTSQPAESVNQTTIISGDRTEYQTSLLSGTEVINTVNAIGMEVNVKENGSITHGIKIVSGDIRLLGSDTWDGTNISLKNALEAIQNNLYIANYNKTASLSSGSNTIALDMTGYTYNGTDIVNVYVDGLYKVNNTDYTITVNDSTGVASINYTAAAAATMAIQVIKPKIGFTALTDNNENNVTDSNGNSIDI